MSTFSGTTVVALPQAPGPHHQLAHFLGGTTPSLSSLVAAQQPRLFLQPAPPSHVRLGAGSAFADQPHVTVPLEYLLRQNQGQIVLQVVPQPAVLPGFSSGALPSGPPHPTATVDPFPRQYSARLAEQPESSQDRSKRARTELSQERSPSRDTSDDQGAGAASVDALRREDSRLSTLREKNKMAQRRYRDRRRTLLSELEESSALLEQRLASSTEELRRLQEENRLLKSQLDTQEADKTDASKKQEQEKLVQKLDTTLLTPEVLLGALAARTQSGLEDLRSKLLELLSKQL